MLEDGETLRYPIFLKSEMIFWFVSFTHNSSAIKLNIGLRHGAYLFIHALIPSPKLSTGMLIVNMAIIMCILMAQTLISPTAVN